MDDKLDNCTDPYDNWRSSHVPTAFTDKVMHWEEDKKIVLTETTTVVCVARARRVLRTCWRGAV